MSEKDLCIALPSQVCVPHCKVCLCIQWELKHKWTVNFVFTKAFTAVLPLSFCWGQQRVSKHSRVWHPDAAWIAGQRLSVHWEGEGGSVPRLKACLFDIAFPRHLTALSVFSCKACITLSFRAYSHCVCMLVFLCVCVCFCTWTPTKDWWDLWSVNRVILFSEES